MKHTKRLLAYVLTFAMVFSCFTGVSLTAKATESKDTAVEIEVGDAIAVTIDTPGESYWVKFTPEEDGEYVFYSQGERDTEAYLHDANMEEPEYNDDGMSDSNFNISYSMLAGEVYYLDSHLLNDEETGDYTLHLEKATKAAAISFDEETYTGYEGEEVYFELLFTPVYAIEEYTYTVNQEGIIDIDKEYDCAELIAPGTVTVTVTTESGCTDSCSVTVKEAKKITAGGNGTVEAVNGEGEKFFATVNEDGTYMLYSDDCDSAYFYLYTNEGAIYSYQDGNARVLVAELKAGETYVCDCFNNAREPYTIHLHKMINATGISIVSDATEGYPGDWFDLEAELEPRYSFEETITWSSDNEEVATVNEYDEVILLKEGTATITAKSDSGLTDTCKVTVKKAPTISIDTKTTVTIEDSNRMTTYSFTPAKDGIYGFYSDTKRDVVGMIYNEDGEEIAYDDDGGEDNNFLVGAELKAGETYYLKAGFYSHIVGSFDVYVTEMKAATEMSFMYSTLTGYVGETKWQDVTFGPGVVQSEGWELLSADETIATIEEGLIVLKTVGTTKVTATSENGLTCECAVTVKEPEKLTLDKELTVELKEDQENIYFAFTPEEDGTYAFYSTDDNGGYCDLLDKSDVVLKDDSGSGVGDNFKIVYDLVAGETYTYVYRIYSDDCSSVSVKLQKATEEVAGIKLSNSAIDGYIDMEATLEVDVLPSNSVGNVGEVTWTSSNPEIVEIDGTYDLSCYLYFVSEGTATVTATTESGLSASCVVTVGKIPEIKVNDTKTINVEYNQDFAAYSFTPEKDGTYVLSTNADAPVMIVVVDSEYIFVDEYYGNTEEPNAILELQLKAGKTYNIACGYNNNQTGTYTISLIDKDNPPVVTPNNPTDDTAGNTNQTTNNNTVSPATGDSQTTLVWTVLLVAAVVTGIGVVVYRKKENE